MDSAVVRVKRRITDEPFDKFVLNCKRAKMCESLNDENQQEIDNTSDATRTILKFAATINEEDDIRAHLTKLRKPEAEELAKKVRKLPSVIAKLREQFKNDAKEQRYKVVNCFRSMNETSTSEGAEATADQITVVDVIKEDDSKTIILAPDTELTVLTNQLDPQTLAQLDKFVYDLYLFDSGEKPTEISPNDYISIRPFDDLVYQGGDEGLNDSDSNDTEDSNVEGNYRNDYPDTDSDYSDDDDEDDIRIAVENLDITTEESSSDDENVYDIDRNVSIVEFLDASTGDEFEYFQRMGRMRKYNQYYRTDQRRWNRRADSDTESDIDATMITDSSSSSSEASPLVSGNEDD